MRHLLKIFFLLFVQIGFGQIDIFDVARKGTTEQLSNLIKINTDTVNSINLRGDSPLLLACYYGNNEVAKKLIEHVENVNIESKEGIPLTATIYSKNFELTKCLINNGANIEFVDIYGKTPLLWALANGDIQTVKFLIEKGANTSIKDKSNMAAIDYALILKNDEIISSIRKQ